MGRSRLRNSIVGLGLVTAVVAIMYVLYDGPAGSASAAQTGGGGDPCWHVGVSDWTCPDSMMARTSDYITSASLTIETKDGRRLTRRLPAGVDAIFLTKESTEKFLLSYYWATNREKAEALTRRLTALRDAAAR
jgi:hypothetical protein